MHLRSIEKSHQRKLVDCFSDPAYKEIGFRNLRIPPTEVGGLFFRSSLQRDRLPKFTNPTNGSWWIVQIQPVHVESHETVVPFISARPALFCRPDLNNPPTSVGGINWELGTCSHVGRT